MRSAKFDALLSRYYTIIIFLILPFIIVATRLFQMAMKVAFNQVRNEVANLNSFVQERLSGMKEIQIFNRQKIEYENFKNINERHKQAWLKTVWYNSIFFPISEFLLISLNASVHEYSSKILSSHALSSGKHPEFF